MITFSFQKKQNHFKFESIYPKKVFLIYFLTFCSTIWRLGVNYGVFYASAFISARNFLLKMFVTISEIHGILLAKEAVQAENRIRYLSLHIRWNIKSSCMQTLQLLKQKPLNMHFHCSVNSCAWECLFFFSFFFFSLIEWNCQVIRYSFEVESMEYMSTSTPSRRSKEKCKLFT